MEELKTILGTEIPIETRGIVYFCSFNYDDNTIKVIHESLFESSFSALQVYANTPNPESQMASGETFDELMIELHRLHKNMKSKEWLTNLRGYL